MPNSATVRCAAGCDCNIMSDSQTLVQADERSSHDTLRAYTVSLNLARFDRRDWPARDEAMDSIADALDRIRKVKLISPRTAVRLQPVDPLALQAGLLGSNPNGLFKL